MICVASLIQYLFSWMLMVMKQDFLMLRQLGKVSLMFSIDKDSGRSPGYSAFNYLLGHYCRIRDGMKCVEDPLLEDNNISPVETLNDVISRMQAVVENVPSDKERHFMEFILGDILAAGHEYPKAFNMYRSSLSFLAKSENQAIPYSMVLGRMGWTIISTVRVSIHASRFLSGMF